MEKKKTRTSRKDGPDWSKKRACLMKHTCCNKCGVPWEEGWTNRSSQPHMCLDCCAIWFKERRNKDYKKKSEQQVTTISPRTREALAAFMATSKLLNYKPTLPQSKIVGSNSKRILVRAANRVGKTLTGCYKIAKAAVNTKDGRFRVVSPNRKQSIEVAQRYLADFLGPWMVEGCEYSLTRGFGHDLIRLKNGATIQFKTNEQDQIAHSGDSLDGVLFDEPPRQDVFGENVARTIDRDGWILICMTPVGREVTWLKNLIEGEDSSWTEFVIPLSTESAPWIDEERIKTIITEAELDPLTYPQRILGAWEGTSPDRFYSAFAHTNLFQTTDLPEEDWQIGIGIDHGELSGHQYACLILYNMSQGIWVLDEYCNTVGTTTPRQDALGLEEMMHRNGLTLHNIDSIVGDINSGGKAAAGKSVNRLLAEELGKALGFNAYNIPANLIPTKPKKTKGSVRYGERLINSALATNTLHIHAEQCPILLNTIKHYRGEESLKHPSDALRYFVTPILDKQIDKPAHIQIQWR